MSQFKRTALYIKTHNITGLKYFGKTIKDPFKYKGSGIYWLSHLRKHGANCTTRILGYYENAETCTDAAINFSKENDIVESKSWANLIDETGLDGGYIQRRHYPHTEETKNKISDSKKGTPAWNKGVMGSVPGNVGPKSDEEKLKISEALKGHKRTAESIEKGASKLRGKSRPEALGWLIGREVSEDTKKKISDSQKGKIVSEDTKRKISESLQNHTVSDETKEKLKGKVVVVDKQGIILRIDKELFYDQTDDGDDRKYVFHNSMEGKKRKAMPYLLSTNKK